MRWPLYWGKNVQKKQHWALTKVASIQRWPSYWVTTKWGFTVYLNTRRAIVIGVLENWINKCIYLADRAKVPNEKPSANLQTPIEQAAQESYTCYRKQVIFTNSSSTYVVSNYEIRANLLQFATWLLLMMPPPSGCCLHMNKLLPSVLVPHAIPVHAWLLP